MTTPRRREAACLIAELIPNGMDRKGKMRILDRGEYQQLSTGERAAYEVAVDLLHGGGALARMITYADERFAGVLLAAITLALGDVLVPCDEGVDPFVYAPEWHT